MLFLQENIIRLLEEESNELKLQIEDFNNSEKLDSVNENDEDLFEELKDKLNSNNSLINNLGILKNYIIIIKYN